MPAYFLVAAPYTRYLCWILIYVRPYSFLPAVTQLIFSPVLDTRLPAGLQLPAKATPGGYIPPATGPPRLQHTYATTHAHTTCTYTFTYCTTLPPHHTTYITQLPPLPPHQPAYAHAKPHTATPAAHYALHHHTQHLHRLPSQPRGDGRWDGGGWG